MKRTPYLPKGKERPFSVIRAQFNDRSTLSLLPLSLSLSASCVTRIDRKGRSEYAAFHERLHVFARFEIPNPRNRQPRKELFLSIRAYATSPNPWQGVSPRGATPVELHGSIGREKHERKDVARLWRKAGGPRSGGGATRGERLRGTEGGPQDQVRGKGSPSRVPYIYNRGAFRVK